MFNSSFPNIKEKDIFIDSLENLIEEINKNNLNETKFPILLNFLVDNLKELKKEIKNLKKLKFSKKIEKFYNCNLKAIFKDYLDVKEYISNSIEKLILDHSHMIGKDILNQFFSNLKIEDNRIKYLIKNKSYNFKEYKVKESERDCINNKNKDLKFKFNFFYLDGSDTYPQYQEFILNKNSVKFEQFLNLLKKSLGIYKYAKFNLIILNEHKQGKISIYFIYLKLRNVCFSEFKPIER